MLSVSNLSLQFGKRILFDEVNITFSPGNCYGIIGANGAGKSTFLKILSKDLEPNTGSVFLESGKRLSVLEQNHNRYDENTVIETVILGNQKLFELKSEIDSLKIDLMKICHRALRAVVHNLRHSNLPARIEDSKTKLKPKIVIIKNIDYLYIIKI